MTENITTTQVNSVHSARLAGVLPGDFVVFLIGMRINRWWKPWTWLRSARTMPRMLRELRAHPELGFLGGEAWFGRTTILMSYWRSTDDLINYAKNRDAEHLPAWRAYNQLIGTSGDLGVWHETYRVHPGDYETVYVNMPSFGLGKVGALVPAHGRHQDAAGRLAAKSTADTPGAANSC